MSVEFRDDLMGLLRTTTECDMMICMGTNYPVRCIKDKGNGATHTDYIIVLDSGQEFYVTQGYFYEVSKGYNIEVEKK